MSVDRAAGAAPVRARPLVVHVLASRVARGAQAHAGALRDEFRDRYGEHVIVTLFADGGGALSPDVALDRRTGLWRRAGLDPAVLHRLRRTLATIDPDVVVAHGGEPLKYVALAGAARRRPLVYLKIGTSATDLDGPITRRFYRSLARRPALVAAVSHETAGEAGALLGVPAHKLRVVPNGRDPGRYRPGPSARTGPPRLIFVGQLNATKRPLAFVDLVDRLRRAGTAVEAAVVGDGPLLDAVTQAGRTGGVEVLGARDDVPDLLADADILVFVGTPPEGMPGVLIEAGLAGLPVVTTDVPGAATVVIDGVTGFVVDVDALDRLAERVRTLVDDAGLRRRMGTAARQHCESQFSIAASADRLRRVIDEALAGPPPLPRQRVLVRENRPWKRFSRTRTDVRR